MASRGKTADRLIAPAAARDSAGRTEVPTHVLVHGSSSICTSASGEQIPWGCGLDRMLMHSRTSRGPKYLNIG
jgi:hypothetical protein